MIFSPDDIILSDFDDTQFRTDELKRDINRKAEELGIKDRYQKLYEKELRGVHRDADRRVDDNEPPQSVSRHVVVGHCLSSAWRSDPP